MALASSPWATSSSRHIENDLWNMGISELCLRRDRHANGTMMMPWFAAVAHLLNSPAPAPLLLGPFSFVGSDALAWTLAEKHIGEGAEAGDVDQHRAESVKGFRNRIHWATLKSSRLSLVVAMSLGRVQARRTLGKHRHAFRLSALRARV